MPVPRRIVVPADYYHQAVELKRAYFKKERIRVPLWRCMIALENSKKNNGDDPFFGVRK
jgi:hypothetical protein